MVWLYPGWFAANWWRDGLKLLSCSLEQMDVAADGHILTGFFTYNPKLERGIAGLNELEYRQIYNSRVNQTKDHVTYDLLKGRCYDLIWLIALVLNNTMNRMTEMGRYLG